MKIRIRVKPNSREQKIEEDEQGLIVRLKSSPTKGKANEELIDLLAKRYDVRKNQITIKSGTSNKLKLIEIIKPKSN
ncbi:MAG: DUF167 domain-containing protein [Flammeovirgaceae bacterium]|nr:DUF167 domain-containing protein [Flammeovirgaceae bacterium]